MQNASQFLLNASVYRNKYIEIANSFLSLPATRHAVSLNSYNRPSSPKRQV